MNPSFLLDCVVAQRSCSLFVKIKCTNLIRKINYFIKIYFLYQLFDKINFFIKELNLQLKIRTKKNKIILVKVLSTTNCMSSKIKGLVIKF